VTEASNFCLFYSQPAIGKKQFRQNTVAEVSFADGKKMAVAVISFAVVGILSKTGIVTISRE
jgi:hypothetical protein